MTFVAMIKDVVAQLLQRVGPFQKTRFLLKLKEFQLNQKRCLKPFLNKLKII